MNNKPTSPGARQQYIGLWLIVRGTAADRQRFAHELWDTVEWVLRSTGHLIEIERTGFHALAAGKWPSTVWTRCRETLNVSAPLGASPREPGRDDVLRFQQEWGNQIRGKAITVLVPLSINPYLLWIIAQQFRHWRLSETTHALIDVHPDNLFINRPTLKDLCK
jgi:hypothetical protein